MVKIDSSTAIGENMNCYCHCNAQILYDMTYFPSKILNPDGTVHVCDKSIKISKPKQERKTTKSKRFRGDSSWQLEQGMGKNKEGSNA